MTAHAAATRLRFARADAAKVVEALKAMIARPAAPHAAAPAAGRT